MLQPLLHACPCIRSLIPAAHFPFLAHPPLPCLPPTPLRGALVLEGGQMRWPAPPLAAPAAPPARKQEDSKKKVLTPEEIYADTLKSALTTTVGLSCIVGLGAVSPGPAFSRCAGGWRWMGALGRRGDVRVTSCGAVAWWLGGCADSCGVQCSCC